MTRTLPPHRLADLVDVASRTLISRGYRLTQMADVADALGVAKGTLYGYVESKEALFDAAIRYADRHLALPDPASLPLRTPAPGATVAYIRERIAIESAGGLLARAGEVEGDAAEVLKAAFSDLYQRIARNRLALKLVDRCALDYPDLADVWFGEGRGAQLRLLTELLRLGTARGAVRRVESPEVVARTILEVIAYWAMHRHFDGAPPTADEETTERAVVDLLVNGLVQR